MTESRDAATDTYLYESNGSGNSPRLDQISLSGGTVRDYSFGPAGHLSWMLENGIMNLAGTSSDGRLGGYSSPHAGGTAAVSFRYDGRSYLRDAWDSCDAPSVMGGGCTTNVSRYTYGSDGLRYQLRRESNQVDGPPAPLSFEKRQSSELAAIAWNYTDHHLYFAGRPVANVTHSPGKTGVEETLRFITVDHLGAPIILTNTNQSISWQGGFEPFGEAFVGTEDSRHLHQRLPGQWRGFITGLQGENMGDDLSYNLHRWYENGTGRYSKPDPLRFSVASNTYSYAFSRPTWFIDPSGLKWITAPPNAETNENNTNTVICFGGRITPNLGDLEGNLERKCCATCVFAHELSHAREAEKENSKLCEGIKDGWLVQQDDPEERSESERRAWTKHLKCMEKLKGRGQSSECEDIVDYWILYIKQTIQSDDFP